MSATERTAIGAGRDRSSDIPPVTHIERVAWHRARIAAALTQVIKHPLDRALMLALEARRDELIEMQVTAARAQRWQDRVT